jgi:2-dehydro-3-deoxygalactonokinase
MNDSAGRVVGIDWGTTNRRAYVLDAGGALLTTHVDDCGIMNVGAGNFEASFAALMQTLQLTEAEVVLSGMVGSRNGWREVPYLGAADTLAELPAALVEIPSPLAGMRCRIVPGYRHADADGTPDVMRGEETQIFGVLAQGIDHGWFLLPGTHSKWVRVERGRLMQLMTFMTGELFALLSAHGTLAGLTSDCATLDAPFIGGLRAAQRSGFTHAAFGCRALVVTDAMPAAHASSYLSGLLIGAELAGIRQRTGDLPHEPVHIVGSSSLAARYVEALRQFDVPSRRWPPDQAYIAALRRFAGSPAAGIPR